MKFMLFNEFRKWIARGGSFMMKRFRGELTRKLFLVWRKFMSKEFIILVYAKRRMKSVKSKWLGLGIKSGKKILLFWIEKN
jgi:hypothetical protein